MNVILWLYRKIFRAGAKKKVGDVKLTAEKWDVARTFFIATEIDGLLRPIEKVEDLEQGLARRKSKEFLADHPEVVGIKLFVISIP